MILVVSDVHLGFEDCNLEAFSRFLDEFHDEKIDHLVLLGDILDFWRRNNAEIIQENKDILSKLNNLKADKIHYIAGNHDYYILDLLKRNYTLNSDKQYNIGDKVTVSKALRLKSGTGENEKSFYFIHGYELEFIRWEVQASLETYENICNEMCFNGNMIGKVESEIWDIPKEIGNFFHFLKTKLPSSGRDEFIQAISESPNKRRDIDKVYNFAVSSGKNYILGMEPNETLVYGHTHRPFITEDKTVANTGSWIDELEDKNQQNSYVEIVDGDMELKFFE
jgi:UDP-2,3-diacylglucosamine pyrophosphatase LpxH